MSTTLEGIASKARENRKLGFSTLAHHVTPEFLEETWKMMNHRGASGIDGITAKEYTQGLHQRVQALHHKLVNNQYRSSTVRRVYIPKPGQPEKKRPLGIPTCDDRLLQRAVSRILEPIYEQDFLACSYGFRPKRNPHEALKELRRIIVTRPISYVYEADIRGYFDHINHQWLRRMLDLRINDGVMKRWLGKWLKAGIMENGVVRKSEAGTPQGGPISPLLSNVYLHYVLDLWFEKKFKRQCRGEVWLIRWADDFVACFQYRDDATMFAEVIRERFQKFHLELVEEKTRLLPFGRFARSNMEKQNKIPATFTFLGFTHICGESRDGKLTVVRHPAKKSCRKFLDTTREWLAKHRHWKPREHQKMLSTMLNGFYRYFGITHCGPKLQLIQKEVKDQWVRFLRKRSQRHRLNWEQINGKSWFQLPEPRIHWTTV